MSLLDRLARAATSLLRGSGGGSASGTGTATRRPGAPSATGRSTSSVGAAVGHPDEVRTTVEYDGPLPALEYAPQPDREADPGEIVWAWVPYEENDGRGKDRPVLVIARHGGGYLGLQTTSKDHDRDRADEARWGRFWIDIGRGAWDREGRESEVRLDRVLYLPADAVRREGAGLDRARYDEVATALIALRRERGQ